MTHASHRVRLFVRLLVLAAIGLASQACYFDGHFGHCHGHHWRAPIRHCR
ncbi:MAG: hypothetical protein AB7O97_04510 [Planctomycetota bacterium]